MTTFDSPEVPASPEIRRRLALGLSALGLSLALAGAFADISSFDRTRGGYEAPYEGWTGTPIDWSGVRTTETGMLREGWVIDFLADCTTGMIHGRIAGVEIPFRPFSERAIVVHKPREACLERGFLPEF
ncbi:MAG: hypothetical protein ACK4GT_05515 [Pararhodobacter sp.]